MSNIRIITDSASDIIGNSHSNITVLPLGISFNGNEFLDGVDINHERFYEMLVESDVLPKTSQINPFTFQQEFEKCVNNGETVIAITLSGKLSGTYQSACTAASEFDGKVFVVDSENVTIGEMALIEYALKLIDKGLEASEIVKELNAAKKKIRLVALLDTLEYLKKGGRISAATAFVGNVLNIKPVIAITKGVVEVLGKARGSKQGNNLLVQQINECGGINFDMPHFLGYTGLSSSLIEKYINDSRKIWETHMDKPSVIHVGASIGTHVGPGAIAAAFFAN
ncbi:MAG: DegV family protein [Eubacteriales bacterium]|nr:DegV family protein [Eubacteriales bacterium]